MANKTAFTKDIFIEFQKDPKAFCKKYGIEFDPTLAEKKYETIEQFKELARKSRLANIFDLG